MNGKEPKGRQTLWDLEGTRRYVWCTARDTRHWEPIEAQRIRQLLHIVGPIEESAVPLEVGQAIARAIDSDPTGAEGCGDRLVGMLKQPSTGGAREEKNRCPLRFPVLSKT